MLYSASLATTSTQKRIAVIGGGIAGLSAAWLLAGRHRVTLYEAEDRLGGHAHTVDVPTPFGSIPVDTGFIVYNPGNYPNFQALLDHLGVDTISAAMSFSASIDDGGFEYSSELMGLMAQAENLVRPAYWLMLGEIVRFYRHAETLLDAEEIAGLTLGAFLDRHNYSSGLVDRHILPMCAAIWSCSAETIRAFPMQAFVRFFSNHNLFKIGRPTSWRTVKGGSRSYVTALRAAMGDAVHVAPGATRITRRAGRAQVTDVTGDVADFDDVVIATHADTALGLLGDVDPIERDLLGAFRYSDNRAVLHEDTSLMPKRRAAWASWNYLDGGASKNADELAVTYWMNRLQGLDRRQNVFITLNPPREPRDSALKRSFSYSHPVFDASALAAQTDLWRLQGRRQTWFCGSYFGYGFHEDALQSGLAIAERFGVRRPWSVANESGRMPAAPELAEAAE